MPRAARLFYCKKIVGARQLVRQDGGRVAHFTVRNRCNLPRRAHQLAIAYKKSVPSVPVSAGPPPDGELTQKV